LKENLARRFDLGIRAKSSHSDSESQEDFVSTEGRRLTSTPVSLVEAETVRRARMSWS